MAQQTGLSHRYSPEFIFAHEFTLHYDEFAQYLPEFGRLRELSRITALIRLLENIRLSNEQSIQALDFLLNPPKHAVPPDTDFYRDYKKNSEKVCQNITSIFQNWQSEHSSSALQKRWRGELHRIAMEIGSLTFSPHSPEVEEACQRWHDQVARDNYKVSSSRIWSEVVNPKRSQIAKDLSASKQKQCRSLLSETFSSRLLSTLGSYAYGRLIDSFIQGDITPLANALILQEQTKKWTPSMRQRSLTS